MKVLVVSYKHSVACIQVVGEYAYMCEDINVEEILRKITSLLNRIYEGMHIEYIHRYVVYLYNLYIIKIN